MWFRLIVFEPLPGCLGLWSRAETRELTTADEAYHTHTHTPLTKDHFSFTTTMLVPLSMLSGFTLSLTI